MFEDRSDILTAGRLIDHIGELGITVAAYRIGHLAEGGWELTALDHESGEWWNVRADRALDAAAELAERLGFDMEE